MRIPTSVRARWSLALLAVVVAGLGLIGHRVHETLQRDPDYCTTCHLMEESVRKWSESAHREVDCLTCHPSNALDNLRRLVSSTRGQITKHAEVSPEACGSCHLSNAGRWKQVGDTAGHRVHWAERQIECVVCHSPGVHQFRPTDEMCRKCHAGLEIGLAPMARNHCTTCHPFLATRGADLSPRREDCGACHGGQWGAPPAVDAGWHPELACAACHHVHRPTKARADAELAAEVEVEETPVDVRAVPCATCHPRPVPRNHDACERCHRPHESFEPNRICAGCHPDRAVTAGARTGTGQPPHTCASCHRPHEPGTGALATCGECHESEAAAIDRRPPDGHDACERCHWPHEASGTANKACGQCHHAAAAGSVTGHETCAVCHDPHSAAGPGASAPLACETCHGEQTAALKPGEHGACEDCHPPHRGAGAAATRCTACHTGEKARPMMKGHDKCGECHGVHGAHPGRAADRCRSCHHPVAQLQASHPSKHGACEVCHLPHGGPAAPGPTPSGDHSAPGGAAKSTPCVECHAPQKESLRAAPRGHQVCVMCHPRHAVRSRTDCKLCHAREEKKAAASAAPEHRDCIGCHGEAHAPKPRATNAGCEGCHERPERKGLHTVTEHADCVQCHGAHGPRPPGDPVCVKCHEIGAMPSGAHPAAPAPPAKAPACVACHSFLEDRPPPQSLP